MGGVRLIKNFFRVVLNIFFSWIIFKKNEMFLSANSFFPLMESRSCRICGCKQERGLFQVLYKRTWDSAKNKTVCICRIF
jgi:hypothetical protein